MTAPRPTSPQFRHLSQRRIIPLIPYHCKRWGYMKAAKADPKFSNGTHKVFRLRATLDREALVRSVDFLVSRQKILAAHVVENTRGPSLAFDGAPVKLDVIHLSHVPAKQRTAEARNAAGDLVWRLFPDEGPWLRVFAITLGPQDHVVGLVLHHFIADGISVSIAAAELLAAYTAFCHGRKPTIPDLPLQYTDYLAGIKKWLEAGDSSGHEAFWRHHLAGAPVTRLPHIENIDTGAMGLEATYEFRISDALVAKMRRQTKCNSIAMVTLVLAAMALSLARLSGSRDITVQTCVSGRTDLRLSGVIGAFFDTVALRLKPADEMPLIEFLKHARAVVLAGYAHQVLSYHLVRPLLAEIGASECAPIMNFFNYYDGASPKALMKLKSFALVPPPPFRRSAKEYPNISFRVVHDARGISGAVEYLDICYNRTTIQRFVKGFTAALTALVSDPAQPLSSVLNPSGAAHLLKRRRQIVSAGGAGASAVLRKRQL